MREYFLDPELLGNYFEMQICEQRLANHMLSKTRVYI